MAPPTRQQLTLLFYLLGTASATYLLLYIDSPWRALWPTAVGLLGVWLLRKVVVSLLVGAFAGALLLEMGNPLAAAWSVPVEHLVPSLTSPWNIGAILFSLMLGGFAALIEAGGGLRTFVQSFLQGAPNQSRRLQMTTIGLGFICFFDGLANALLIGRVTRSLARPAGVSPAKMAYLADSTSSTVACIAFISTWIATQLTLIQSSLDDMHLLEDYTATGLYFASIPTNFYVLTALLLMIWSVWTNWNIGPMAAAERRAQEALARGEAQGAEEAAPSAPFATALIPLVLLVGGIMGLFYFWEARPLWPVTLRKVALSFSSGDGAMILVLGTLPGLIAAYLLYPRRPGEPGPLNVFLRGARDMAAPLLILAAAWIIGSVIGALDAADAIAQLLQGNLPINYLPLAVFLVGAFISFSTGSAWGTMALLMPLALPAVFALEMPAPCAPLGTILAGVVGAVFGGAVFGDHCSPFSDTTIMASIACEVEPVEHVRTQMPYAFIGAAIASLVGYWPLGLGWTNIWGSLAAMAAIVLALPFIFRQRSLARGA
ncbi:MAG: Na+/H+ antiporter NhaC family protein [Verrucomicrobiota bacterium JB022]|nr:Na+/H+ antiporter NhaC family protein [Verrucomicrobiota bacterium JB022]